MASRCPAFVGTFASSCRTCHASTVAGVPCRRIAQPVEALAAGPGVTGSGTDAVAGPTQDCGQLCAGAVAPGESSIETPAACLCAATPCSTYPSLIAAPADVPRRAICRGPRSLDDASDASDGLDAQDPDDDKGNAAGQNGVASTSTGTALALVVVL
ncbi:hypothetical protein AURDEDRAFT_173145 [Auricularia subglabra TFB-10046 SS5]|nr:hypothetical protein AURDEDRAFT_173145 [Auricularia subglabra TFB-10046 SS5]